MVLYIRDKISTSTKASAALYNVMSITKKPSAKKNNKTLEKLKKNESLG